MSLKNIIEQEIWRSEILFMLMGTLNIFYRSTIHSFTKCNKNSISFPVQVKPKTQRNENASKTVAQISASHTSPVPGSQTHET